MNFHPNGEHIGRHILNFSALGAEVFARRVLSVHVPHEILRNTDLEQVESKSHRQFFDDLVSENMCHRWKF